MKPVYQNQNNKLSITDLELLKDALDKLFSQKNGFELHIEEDQQEIVAYEYVFQRLSHINDYRNKYIKDRLRAFNAYLRICDNSDFKKGINKLYASSKNVTDYRKLALKMLRMSGYKEKKINLCP